MAGMNPAPLPHLGLVLGSTDKTLACEAGAFSFTGVAASLGYTGGGVSAPAPLPHLSLLLEYGAGSVKTLACSAGAITFAGVAATLKSGRRAVCSAGAFNFTGVAATLTKTGANSTEFPAPLPHLSSLLGGIETAKTLPCAAGSFTLAGVAAGLNRGTALTCEAGSILFAGAPAERDIELNGDTGAFLLAGQDAILKKTYTPFTADAGAFNLAGGEALFRYLQAGNYAIACFPGAFQVAGQSAALTPSPRLALEVGAFNLSGGDADLRYSGAGLRYGKSRTRRTYERKYVVEVDGEEFIVESLEEAQDLLAMTVETVQEVAKTPTKAIVKTPRIRAKGPSGPELDGLVDVVSAARNEIKALLAEMNQVEEIARLIQQQDEEEALIALL